MQTTDSENATQITKLHVRSLRDMVDTLSISGGSVSTSSATIVGIGTSAGKGLMVLGEVTLRGWETVNTRLKLLSIGAQLSRLDISTVPTDVYVTLLELQRCDIFT